MQPHTAIYIKHFGFDISDFIPCEICQQRATDIHHIEARGMGGTSQADTINNLMALCRTCHINYGDITELKPILHTIHGRVIQYFAKYGTTLYQQ